MKFYDCSTAPSPRRARVFIAEKGLLDSMERIDVNLREKEQMTPEFAKINPFLTVPVLELDDGTRLNATVAIWRHLEETHPEPPLMGRTPVEKALIAQWQWRIEMDGFQAVGECLRNSVPGMAGRGVTGKHSYEQIPALAERGKLRAERFMETLDEAIGDKPFVVGDAYSVADIDALVFVDFAKWIKVAVPDSCANVARWYASVSERPSAKL